MRSLVNSSDQRSPPESPIYQVQVSPHLGLEPFPRETEYELKSLYILVSDDQVKQAPALPLSRLIYVDLILPQDVLQLQSLLSDVVLLFKPFKICFYHFSFITHSLLIYFY